MTKHLGFALPRFYRRNLWAQVTLGLVLGIYLNLVGALLMPIYFWGSPMGYIGLLVGAWILSLLFHECGHATAGYLVGAPARLIVLGGPPTLFRARLFGTQIEINTLPTTGRVEFHSPEESENWRMIIAILGGALGNVILILLLAALESNGTQLTVNAGRIIMLMQAAYIFHNLIPWFHLVSAMPTAPVIPRTYSDGDLLLNVMRGRGPGPWMSYDEITAPYRASDAPAGRPSPGAIVALRHRFESDQPHMRAFLLNELARGRMTGPEEMALLDALITSTLQKGGQGGHAEMESWSERLYELGSDFLTVRGTRGAVLARTGRSEEARTLLAPLLSNPDVTPFDLFMANLMLAQIEFDLSDREKARAHFETAAKIATDEQIAVPTHLYREIQQMTQVGTGSSGHAPTQ